LAQPSAPHHEGGFSLAELNDSPYEVLAEIGRGRYARVYLARDRASGELRAIKLLGGAPAADREHLLRLKREARVLRNVESPHIVKIFDQCFVPGRAPYLVMEYLEGNTLQAELDGAVSLPAALAVRWAREALLGLHVAHQAGVTHRDLNPSNLFLHRPLGQAARLKLIDFGLTFVEHSCSANDLASSPASHLETQTGSFLGSPAYASPEALRGGQLDARSDIYSIGLILHHCLTGQHPLEVLTDTIPLLELCAPQLPKALDYALSPALSLLPAERYSNALAFATALEAALGQDRHGTVSCGRGPG